MKTWASRIGACAIGLFLCLAPAWADEHGRHYGNGDDPVGVPEPAAMALLGGGLVSIVAVLRRRMK